MAAGFERVSHTSDGDTDISMVDLRSPDFRYFESIGSPTPLLRQPSTDTKSTGRQQIADDASDRSLLRPDSFATTSDYEKCKESPSLIDAEPPRQRTGFRDNLPLYASKSWRRNSKTLVPRRTNSSFDGNLAHGKPGWWHKQMLVDRSLRTMAGFTTVCAVVMLIIVLCYAPAFSRRLNLHTTSVGGESGESCQSAESRNVAVHLFVNIAATMLLGCSNTYQQLVTALKVDEIPWVLSKFGDSKVGTNSPWSINHKRDGKARAWSCWLLLILTSAPIHFLANSVIGPSFYISMPSTITFTELATPFPKPELYRTSSNDAACWTAFRSHQYVLPTVLNELANDYNIQTLGNTSTFQDVEVLYTSNCTAYRENTDVATALTEWNTAFNFHAYNIGGCLLGESVSCRLGNATGKSCRMNVRMQAAIILASCLLIKSIYMIALNIRWRHRTKDHCLTFGDIMVATVVNPDLKIKNECMLNSGDGHRQEVSHVCHKHCQDSEPSKTGDDIGHCQKCKKFNDINMSADLPHPSIAIKYKRSLLSNLGSTAITQMLILMFTSLLMVALSVTIIIFMAITATQYQQDCSDPAASDQSYIPTSCSKSLSKSLAESYGTWGGFSSSATLSVLPADSLYSESLAFAISNGPQFLYSLLYMLLIYNLSLISMEHEWGSWERTRKRPRCTIVSGRKFEQSYFLLLPSKVLLPLMALAALMHWLLGQAISTAETIYTDAEHGVEHSLYFVTYAAYPIFISTILMVATTVMCWWAFTYTREGFMPQMFGSIRACCASTSELTDFSSDGILWGDLGKGDKYRHAGFSIDEPGRIIPGEVYSGRK